MKEVKMINNPFIFYTTALLMILFLFLTFISKKIIYSLLSAIGVFFLTALFFYQLGSEYNAIIQASIYGFAVPIILGVSIMFTNNKKENIKSSFMPFLTFLFAGIFVLALVYLIMISLATKPDTFMYVDKVSLSYYDVISAFARGIFVNYVWAFELVSLLLTIVVAGIAIFKRKGA